MRKPPGQLRAVQRALIAVSSRSGDVAELITRRLATLAHSGLQALDEPTVLAVVRQAVRDVRTAPPPGRAVDELATSTHAIGELMLEVAPAYLSGIEAADVLALRCEESGQGIS
ncbi:hypothetical protein RFN58_29535 [Streptomyces iakyrus]|uniref:hypothetical protein n=1 Tax=Streptomyces iakyrus TaxID=68219 RepID=UPI000A8511B1|nr:hypothetical protein [Streptomyces iakyrus]